MKDRTADGGTPTPEQLLAEKAALKEEGILVVLGHLHAVLKELWTWKVGTRPLCLGIGGEGDLHPAPGDFKFIL